MNHPLATIDQATLDWLLEPENPTVRRDTLRHLLDRPEDDPEVVEAGRAIMRNGPVPEILSQQAPEGFWGIDDRFYLDKYAGTVWQLLMLAELGADPQDGRIAAACRFILDHAQERTSGGFSINGTREHGGRPSKVIPCLTGNMVYSLIRLGHLDDPRTQAGIDWICRYQRCDDGDGLSAGLPQDWAKTWPYSRYDMCWGNHTCHMGVVKALKALAAIPEIGRSPAVAGKIGELTEYMLAHHVYKKSHAPDQVARPGWMKFGFPLMYQSDALEVLGILASLGCRDDRMRDALALVRSKQGSNFRWPMENTFNGKMRVDIEKKGRSSKWLTLRAVAALRACD